jgi:transcriptional regulator with XRE-family HTH domain
VGYSMGSVIQWPLPMSFPTRLVQLRKQHGLSQQRLAAAVGVHVNQVRRYEAGTAQPTLDTLVSLAKALSVNLDTLVFDADERGPSDELRLQFEAVSQLPDEEKRIVKALIDGMLIKYQTKRLVSGLSS